MITWRSTIILYHDCAQVIFHQATYHFVLNPQFGAATKLKYLAISYVIVVLQISAAIALIIAIGFNTCGSSRGDSVLPGGCRKGTWCPANEKEVSKCKQCGTVDRGTPGSRDWANWICMDPTNPDVMANLSLIHI